MSPSIRTFVALGCGIALSLVLLSQPPSQSGVERTPQLGKDPIADVVAAMTLREKVDLVVGEGMAFAPPTPGDAQASEAGSAEGPSGPTVGDSLSIVPGAAGATSPVQRLRIPATVLADGPAGIKLSAAPSAPRTPKGLAAGRPGTYDS